MFAVYYQFSLRKPGTYAVAVTSSGFQSAKKQVGVALGAACLLPDHLLRCRERVADARTMGSNGKSVIP